MIHKVLCQTGWHVCGGEWGGRDSGAVGRLADLDCADPKESCPYPAPTCPSYPTNPAALLSHCQLRHLVYCLCLPLIRSAHPSSLVRILPLHPLSTPLTASSSTASSPELLLPALKFCSTSFTYSFLLPPSSFNIGPYSLAIIILKSLLCKAAKQPKKTKSTCSHVKPFPCSLVPL